ncbi:MAG: PAS domain-containing protein [Mariprofundales bacterium]|nr:PAS domain-containing protein [Mariprofundales bacterium]
MRNNQPVTNREQLFPEGEFLISKTDLTGTITYANRAFCRIAGYSEGELIGQPHNIVRHPDMPEAAFAELWHDVQNGQEWHGLVKNRCKNGDHYWVKATIMAELDAQGSILGYISVRRSPASAGMSSEECATALAELVANVVPASRPDGEAVDLVSEIPSETDQGL